MMRMPVICLVLGIVAFAAQASNAAELLMFEKDGCPWCARWHQDIGQGYPHTLEGRRAPLKVFKLAEARPAGIELDGPITFSPTFVLADQGREVGRIVGFAGGEFFYGLLAGLLRKMDKPSREGANCLRLPSPPSKPTQ